VYAVGLSRPSVKARYLAAVLACGPGSILSHRSAAALWGLYRSNRAAVDVSATRRTGKTRVGIEVHRASGLLACDKTRIEGVPCTSVARTLLDLAETLDRHALERAVERAEILRVFDLSALQDVLARAAGRRGAASLRTILATYVPDPAFTRSELEKRFLALCLEAGIPRPQVNLFTALPRDAFEIDFTWPDRRVIVETDSYRYHGTRRAFEGDRRRDQQATAAGWRVVRFTWAQVFREPEEVRVILRAVVSGDGRY
jgi:Protein of unknown function (DUF559)